MFHILAGFVVFYICVMIWHLSSIGINRVMLNRRRKLNDSWEF